jgi:hypothetical protein
MTLRRTVQRREKRKRAKARRAEWRRFPGPSFTVSNVLVEQALTRLERNLVMAGLINRSYEEP